MVVKEGYAGIGVAFLLFNGAGFPVRVNLSETFLVKTTDSAQPFSVGEDKMLKMRTKTLLVIIGGVLIAAASWWNIKADSKTHGEQLAVMQAAQAADHGQLVIQGTILQQQQSMLERIDRKLDRLAERRISIGGGGSSGP